MLVVEALSKKYGKVLANDNLNFSVPAGEITILAGPNGAGKSTAIKAMAGLLRYEGSITIDGHPNKSIQAKKILGYIPETPSLYGLLTIKEHLEFIARAYSLEDYEERAQELLTRFELNGVAEKVGKELSKGMQQKVSICCALMIQPKLLLVDEPMVGLDPHAIKTLKEVFMEEKQKGKALLISTHLLESVEDLWDRAIILMQGKIAATKERSGMEERGEKLNDLFFAITEGSER